MTEYTESGCYSWMRGEFQFGKNKLALTDTTESYFW